MIVRMKVLPEMASESNLLIAGCGYVGGRLAGLFAADGHKVYALRRSTAVAPAGVTAVRADLADAGSLRVLPPSLSAVVFAAAPSSPDEAGYRRIYLDGLRNLIDALSRRAAPPARLIFTSSTAVYAQSDGEWVDETSPTRPQYFRGQVLLEAESMLRDAPIEGSVLRLGGIYGPGRLWQVEQIQSGRARVRSGPPHYTNRIHRDDAAGAIRHLISLQEIEAVYLGVDSRPADEGEVLRYIARGMNLPDPPTVAPGEPQPPRRAGNKRCRNDRLVSSGYRFRFPTYREGYADLASAAGNRDPK